MHDTDADRMSSEWTRAVEWYAAGAWHQAEQSCGSLLASHPGHFDALHLLGAIAAQTGRPAEAAVFFGRAAAARPGEAVAHLNRAIALGSLGRFREALESVERALTARPAFAEAHHHRGETLEGLGRLDGALASYQRAAELQPDFADAHHGRATVLARLSRFEEALAGYARTLELQPCHEAALFNRGNVQGMLGRFDDALISYDAALQIGPGHAEAWNNRGNVLQELGRLEDALASYDKALSLKPDLAEGHFNRGVTLQRLGRFAEALVCHDRALTLRPEYAEALFERGMAQLNLHQLGAASDSFDAALRLNPRFVEAHFERGDVLQRLSRFDAARESFERAWRLAPDTPWLCGARLHAKLQLCDWSGWSADTAELASRVRDGREATPPFTALAVVDAPDLHRAAADRWVRARCPAPAVSPAAAGRRPDDVIRLGYFSSDFQLHPVAHLAAGLFECHDRQRFRLCAFSFGPPSQDGMRRRLTGAFDEFLDVRAMPDADVARLARDRGIDVAIDLNGFTRHARPGIFAHRTAPLQANYLGYPGTMGAPFMDYVIADRIVVPPGAERDYAEKIVRLPHCYQPNDRRRPIATETPPRTELGLPPAGFVYCCFNNSYKITPDIFSSWMRILGQVDGSLLWLLEDSPTAADNLRREAQRRGIDPGRLLFARRLPNDQHLARHRAADLFLDTFPYNAHTTASDALWAGLPLLTRPGRSFASRVASSLLQALALPELIVDSPEDYESMAIDLARSPARLAGLRATLGANRLVEPLFDTATFARHLETAYALMIQRFHARLAPDHLHVPA